MVQEQDDRWFQVLAGNAPAQDRDTRQAQQLREYFVAEAQNTPPLDEAAQRRIMNLLEAKGAFAEPKPQQAAPGLLDKLAAWLLPDGNPFNRHFAGVAAAVLAVMVLPFMLHSPVGEDDPYGIKGGQGGATPSAVITSASPEQSAAMLMAVLAKHGVAAKLSTEGDARWVQSQVPPDRLAAVQADLVSMGLAASADGSLNVQFRLQR